MSRSKKNAGSIPFAAAVHTNAIDFVDNTAAGKISNHVAAPPAAGTLSHALVAGPPAYVKIDQVTYVPRSHDPLPHERLSTPVHAATEPTRRAPRCLGQVDASHRVTDAVRQFMRSEVTHAPRPMSALSAPMMLRRRPYASTLSAPLPYRRPYTSILGSEMPRPPLRPDLSTEAMSRDIDRRLQDIRTRLDAHKVERVPSPPVRSMKALMDKELNERKRELALGAQKATPTPSPALAETRRRRRR
jgi:hypothetical protein